MPSFKDKYQNIKRLSESMERRVLLNEVVLAELRDRIESLLIEKDNAVEKEKISDYQKNQLYLALTEIEELVLSQKVTPPDLASRTTSEVFEIVVDSIHRISKSLRDSNVRANTIFENILDFPKGKLLKRERKEQILRNRNASVSSLAERMDLSPGRSQLASPPPIFRERSGSNSTTGTRSCK